MMKPTQTSMNNHIMPIMMPQINDPRIVVQTFNAPNPPILPGALPQAKIVMNVELPKQRPKHVIVHRKVINVPIQREEIELEKHLKDEFESQFETALNKDYLQTRAHKNGVSVHMKNEPMKTKVQMLLTPTSRLIQQYSTQKRVERIENKIESLDAGCLRFGDEMRVRLDHMDLLAKMVSNAQNSVILGGDENYDK